MYYDNFVFYGSWREALEGFKEDFGEDYAKETLWNLMLLATTGEIETEKKSIIGFLNGTVLPNIKAAQDRYSKAIEKGKNGGRTKIELPIEEIEDLISKGKTQKEVAALYNVSVDTIQRRLKEYRAGTAKPQNETAECGRPQNLEIEIDKEIYKEFDKEIDSIFLSSNCPEIEKQELKDYISLLSDKRKDDFIRTIKRLKKSLQWIYRAIKHKKIEDWEKWGFGLLNTEDFQKEIDLKIENEIKKETLKKQEQERIKNDIQNQLREEKQVIYISVPEKKIDKGLIDLDSIT